MRYAKRVDDNHAVIRDGIRAAGYPVLDLSKCGQGVPDLSVMVGPFKAVFLEVKDGAKVKSAQKLTKAEETWQGHWSHVTKVVNSLEQALQVIKEAGE